MTAKDALKRVTLKKVVIGRGHDGLGLIADVYLDGKMVATFHDDGWGGEPEIRFSNKEAENKMNQLMLGFNIAKYMFENGWAFMKSASKIDLQTQITFAIEEAANRIEDEKFAKKRDKLCEASFVYGTAKSYFHSKWKGFKSLKDIAAHPSGVKALQASYDRIKTNLKEGEKIFNTESQLKSLGIVI